MSRTYRTHLEHRTLALGRYWTWEEELALIDKEDFDRTLTRGWNGHYFLDRKCRDRKPWNKPAKFFKSMKRRIERAKVKSALLTERDIPVFRRSDQWDWA